MRRALSDAATVLLVAALLCHDTLATPSLVRRAEQLARVGRFQEAMVPLQQRLKVAPRDAVARTTLANVYDALGLTKLAEREIRKLLIITRKTAVEAPSFAATRTVAAARYQLAQHILRHKGKEIGARDAAIAELRRCVELSPTHDNAKHWLAHQLMRLPGQSAAASALLSSVRLDKLTGSHPLDTLMLLGQARERLGDLDGVLS